MGGIEEVQATREKQGKKDIHRQPRRVVLFIHAYMYVGALPGPFSFLRVRKERGDICRVLAIAAAPIAVHI